jgi:hypothetical protein
MLIVGESKNDAGEDWPVPRTKPAWAALDVWASRFPNCKPNDFVFPPCENGNVDHSKPIRN